MKNIKKAFVLLLLISFLIGCSDKSKLVLDSETIEFGQDISKMDLFKYQGKVIEANLSMTVDSGEIGTYRVTATYGNEAINKELKVIDNEFPQIEFKQDITKIFKVPLGSDYDLKSNLKKVIDKVDGEIKTINIVSRKEYIKVKNICDKNKRNLNDRVFNDDGDLEKAKSEKREKNSCIFIYSDIDTQKPDKYEITVLAIDYNYNIQEKNYSIEVVSKDTNINEESLAAGVKANSKKESTSKATKTTANISGSENINSISSTHKVVKAALARVGQKFWCDELVSQALVDAGVLTGDNSVFPGGFLALSTYSSIGKSISKSQLKPGDVLYYDDAGSGLKHVAIYVGNNKAVHGGASGIKVVLGRVNIGKGPSKYYRMPSHLTWNEACEMVFGYNPSNPSEDFSNPGGKNPNTDVYTERSVSKSGEKFLIKGKNIDVNAVDSLINQFLDDKITRDAFVSQIKKAGCTVDISGKIVTEDVWYEIKFSTDQGDYIVKGMNVSTATEQALDDLMLDFMFENIDEEAFIQKAKTLGLTVIKQ